MKRFLLFAGDVYYPCGGWVDFVGEYETLELAKLAAAAMPRQDWWHIVDLEALAIVWPPAEVGRNIPR